MKKHTLLTLSLVILFCVTGFAQRRKTVFLEGFGNGILFSGNFELRLKKNSNSGSGVRIGLGGGTLSGVSNGNFIDIGIVTIPLGYNYLIGEKRSSFEIGAGITPIIVSANASIDNELVSGKGFTLTGFLNAGYRFQPLNNGFFGKITWTPIATNQGFFPAFAGISLGFSFK